MKINELAIFIWNTVKKLPNVYQNARLHNTVTCFWVSFVFMSITTFCTAKFQSFIKTFWCQYLCIRTMLLLSLKINRKSVYFINFKKSCTWAQYMSQTESLKIDWLVSNVLCFFLIRNSAPHNFFSLSKLKCNNGKNEIR